MRELVRKLYPYCARHKWIYAAGILVILIQNLFYVRSTVYVGRTVDYLLGRK